jgi:uncharacterized protein YcnI
MRVKAFVGAGLAGALLLVWVAPAWAHVTVDPASAPQGSETTIRFRVPNEVTGANVVKVDIAFPTDHPLLGVDVEPIAGWTSAVTEAKLNPPVQTDDGPVTQAVSEIVWTAASGGGTAPSQFQEFPVLVQQLPKDTSQVTFKAIQTYSDGTVVNWDAPPAAPGAEEPEHPAPVLKLVSDDDKPQPASTTDDVARWLGIAGLVVGVLGLGFGIGTALRSRRTAK